MAQKFTEVFSKRDAKSRILAELEQVIELEAIWDFELFSQWLDDLLIACTNHAKQTLDYLEGRGCDWPTLLMLSFQARHQQTSELKALKRNFDVFSQKRQRVVKALTKAAAEVEDLHRFRILGVQWIDGFRRALRTYEVSIDRNSRGTVSSEGTKYISQLPWMLRAYADDLKKFKVLGGSVKSHHRWFLPLLVTYVKELAGDPNFEKLSDLLSLARTEEDTVNADALRKTYDRFAERNPVKGFVSMYLGISSSAKNSGFPSPSFFGSREIAAASKRYKQCRFSFKSFLRLSQCSSPESATKVSLYCRVTKLSFIWLEP